MRERLVAGQVNGTAYAGDCCCLIGTLAEADGGIEKVCSTIPFYEKGLHNPGEQWFWNIREGDTPDNSFFVKHAVDLCDMVVPPSGPERLPKKKGLPRGRKAGSRKCPVCGKYFLRLQSHVSRTHKI